MNRYNLGFYKFGPLEQCSDGELIYYKDHVQIRNDLKDQITDRHIRLLELSKENIKNERKAVRYKKLFYVTLICYIGSVLVITLMS